MGDTSWVLAGAGEDHGCGTCELAISGNIRAIKGVKNYLKSFLTGESDILSISDRSGFVFVVFVGCG
jgi:hypothetical protein